MQKQSEPDLVEPEAQRQDEARPRGHPAWGSSEDVLTFELGLNEGLQGFKRHRQGEALPARGNSSTSIWPRVFITTRLTFHVESKPIKENRPEQESQTTF